MIVARLDARWQPPSEINHYFNYLDTNVLAVKVHETRYCVHHRNATDASVGRSGIFYRFLGKSRKSELLG